ncbi:DUF2254 domain-containing protein [Aestuariivirga sp.]|uniref:DUF2254 domain-containing protein n=1 Tax=Aestuariivirga sp. TaxID=2650926 RepID=UPI00391DAFF0
MSSYRNILALLQGQLWLIPALFALGAVLLAVGLLGYGSLLIENVQRSQWWLYSGEARTARDLLSSLLAGLMTMTSLVVSVTFVILTLAANQLGPRLIQTFMGDRQIQAVLGLFVGTILYVILVLRTLDDTLGSEGVPHLAITAASLLTVICLLALLFYIHKVARSIVADNVIEAVARAFRHTLHDILPERREHSGNAGHAAASAASWAVPLARIGYLQVVDYRGLVELACEYDMSIDVRVRAGDYLLRNGDHIAVHAAAAPAEKTCVRIRAAFTIGAERTPAQDPEYGLRHLVEIATRALSPGINDLFSAAAVLDRLGAVFEEVFCRDPQPCRFADANGTVRVTACRSSVEDLLDAALQPIRQSARGHPMILIGMADVLAKLAAGTTHGVQRKLLLKQLIRLEGTVSLGSFTGEDRRDILEAIARARRGLVEDVPEE